MSLQLRAAPVLPARPLEQGPGLLGARLGEPSPVAPSAHSPTTQLLSASLFSSSPSFLHCLQLLLPHSSFLHPPLFCAPLIPLPISLRLPLPLLFSIPLSPPALLRSPALSSIPSFSSFSCRCFRAWRPLAAGTRPPVPALRSLCPSPADGGGCVGERPAAVGLRGRASPRSRPGPFPRQARRGRWASPGRRTRASGSARRGSLPPGALRLSRLGKGKGKSMTRILPVKRRKMYIPATCKYPAALPALPRCLPRA